MSKDTEKCASSPNVAMIAKRLYTIEEAAIYLGRTVWSVRELIWKGILPGVKVGRRVHLDLKDLDHLVETYKTWETG